MASSFREAIVFFETLGIYDVVLPFLLVFSLMFAILEKTKILGLEKKLDLRGGEWKPSPEMTRKNLNAMISFVVAFLVVASTKLVAIINQTLANVVLLLILSFCFLLLMGSFAEEKDKPFALTPGWATFMKIIMALGIFLIFFNALGWLDIAYKWVVQNWDTTSFMTLALFVIVVLIMVGVTGGFERGSGSSGGKSAEKD